MLLQPRFDQRVLGDGFAVLVVGDDALARVDVHRIYSKLNYQVAPKHSLTFSLGTEWYKTGGGGSSLQAPSTVADEHGSDPAPSLTWRSIFGIVYAPNP